MSEKRIPPPPTPNKDDELRDGVSAVLSVIPIPGVSDVFQYIVEPPISRRLDAWRGIVADVVNELLVREVVTVESILENESFTTAVLHASQVAVRTSKREKHEALRNAVLNSALPNAPEEDLQVMFLHLLDVLSVQHILILNSLESNPSPKIDVTMKENPIQTIVLERIVAPLFASISKKELAHTIANDLLSRGLVTVDEDMSVNFYDEIRYEANLTDFALGFLDFIKSPFEDDREAQE